MAYVVELQFECKKEKKIPSMSNTETKIKEMDMTDSIRCVFLMTSEYYVAGARTHTLVKSHNLWPDWLTIDCLSSKVSENDKRDSWLLEGFVSDIASVTMK